MTDVHIYQDGRFYGEDALVALLVDRLLPKMPEDIDAEVVRGLVRGALRDAPAPNVVFPSPGELVVTAPPGDTEAQAITIARNALGQLDDTARGRVARYLFMWATDTAAVPQA